MSAAKVSRGHGYDLGLSREAAKIRKVQVANNIGGGKMEDQRANPEKSSFCFGNWAWKLAYCQWQLANYWLESRNRAWKERRS